MALSRADPLHLPVASDVNLVASMPRRGTNLISKLETRNLSLRNWRYEAVFPLTQGQRAQEAVHRA